jgi:hypothetical protein
MGFSGSGSNLSELDDTRKKATTHDERAAREALRERSSRGGGAFVQASRPLEISCCNSGTDDVSAITRVPVATGSATAMSLSMDDFVNCKLYPEREVYCNMYEREVERMAF